ncbi:MAG: phosphoenolpyruvate carboxylase [Parvibaculaceae bacterium]
MANTTRHILPVDGGYVDEITVLLRDLLRHVIRERAPKVLAIIDDPEDARSIRPELIAPALQVIGIWLQLLNIAEENAAMRSRRRLETMGGNDQILGSFSNAFATIAAAGASGEAVAKALEMAEAGPTITAHPTEAKRVTVLEIHRRIYLRLYDLESPRWTPREREALVRQLRNDIDLLWLTGEIRLEKPTVETEVAWGLHFFREALFERTPQLCELLEGALARHYPEQPIRVRPPVRFYSWIGGDRDGNPYVTVATTRWALEENAKAAVERLDKRLENLVQTVSVSEREADVPEAFRSRVAREIAHAGDEGVAQRNRGEPFRQYFSALRSRLAATASPGDFPDCKPFGSPDELAEAIHHAERALAQMHATSIAAYTVRPVRWEVEIFGFRTMSLDMRQNTTVINRVLAELWQKFNPTAKRGPPEPDSSDWAKWVLAELKKPMGFLPLFQGLSEEARETLDLLGLIRASFDGTDPKATGAFVLSMTRSATDILGLYLLAKYSGLFTDAASRESSRLPIVPLFETIDDLQRAPGIMEELFKIPMVRRSIKAQGGRQEIMLGYSDSNKDGGFFCASFELYETQRRLVKVARAAGIEISFFHGRGGSVSRGGAPTGRAVAAQPAGTVGGRMRVTEQGEVVSSKFANRGTALYHLEVLASSVLVHTFKSTKESALRLIPRHQEAVEAISASSFKAYRGLAEDPGLMDYFQAASPVEELSLLKMGSRPARRFGAKGVEDLRAIPWVFAWSQNRHVVTGWYGLGTALDQYIAERGDEGLVLLKDMFGRSRGFRLAIDEVEKSLYLADMEIARLYAGLVPDRKAAERILGCVETEHALTRDRVLALSGASGLCARFPGFRRRFDRVRPMIDQANRWQIDLLRDARAGRHEDKALTPLLMTMNCIAAGLGWTG